MAGGATAPRTRVVVLLRNDFGFPADHGGSQALVHDDEYRTRILDGKSRSNSENSVGVYAGDQESPILHATILDIITVTLAEVFPGCWRIEGEILRPTEVEPIVGKVWLGIYT